MAMTIPQAAFNWAQFYLEAKAKGIKIKSRYRGVSARVLPGTRIYWQVQLTAPDGSLCRFPLYPFTKEGERMAGNTYVSKCMEFGYDPEVGKPNLRNQKKIL